MINHKKNLIDSLKVMRDNAEGPFQGRAYDKVIKNLELITVPITCYKQIENIEGAGKKIKLKFQEIINTGSLEEAEKIINNGSNDIKLELLQVYGIGPAKAKNLIDNHKIKSIDELREKSKKDPKLLTDAQKIGLITYEDLLERIPRKEMLKHQAFLNISKDKGEIVGSFRRREENSGDIDIMLNMDSKEFEQFTSDLLKKNYIRYVLAKGDKKMLAICKINDDSKYRRIDLIRNSPEEYPYMKLYFSGPKEFNVAFRQHSLNKGLSLNEHGFTPEVKGLKTEKDIFEYLGLKYVEPENRNGNCLNTL